MKKILTDLLKFSNDLETENPNETAYWHLQQLRSEIRGKALSLLNVSNWVAIESNEQPELCSDVMVKYKDGNKEVAYFDGDRRFYIESKDWDVTDKIIEWHRLP